jgi:diguanylate cyclase
MQTSDWKRKYQDAIKELDSKEAEWQVLEEILRRAIARLSIVSLGLDHSLDEQLTKIQALSRQKQDRELGPALDKLSAVISSLEDDKPASSAQEDPDPNIQVSPEGGNSIADVISVLLEQLSLLPATSDSVSKIQARVLSGIDDSQWPDTLEEIADTISETIKNIYEGKRQLESFIENVTEQLGAITQLMTDGHEDSLSEHGDTLSLHNMMQKSVATIKDNVDAAENIDQLKSEIVENIDVIRKGMDDFVERAKTRYDATEKRNKDLSIKLAMMEKEADELKKELDSNKEKLLYDALTGVRSRLAYDEHIAKELSRWNRHKSPFTYAIIDIDHFKNVNDKYGHSAGDKALQIIGKLMQKQIRKSDFVYRIGGEEFVFILPDTSVDNAGRLVEKLRRAIRESEFHFNQERVFLTVSAGLTGPDENDDVESIYKRADSALYAAKNEGRDCQTVA